MANASADKLKALGLRHGEKVVMGLAMGLCLLFLVMAATQPTIDLTPEQVRKAADAADSNLRNRQNPEDILKRLEDAGIKNPEFEKVVDHQIKDRLNPLAYQPRGPWITPEPGAGLIRDMPELIAPTELIAYPGRGGALLFALDESGNKIPDESKTAEEPKAARKRRVSAKAAARALAKRQAEEKKYLLEKRKREAALSPAGEEKAKGKAKAKEEPEETPAAEGPFKETTQGLRWVAITGILDYKKLRENYLLALKVPSIAFPHFKQLDVERQARQSDGTWSDWETVDVEKNQRILFNLPEVEEEWTPESVRIEALVDPLPFLKSGYWERVHVASLVPKEKKEVAKPNLDTSEGSGSMMMMSSPTMNSPAPTMTMSMPMSMSYGPAGGAETIDFDHKPDSDTLMIRSLDFTVEPDQTYRFRVRIVVFNPNRDREDVTPGVDNKSPELFGPWSEATDEVTMPADVATYALQKVPSAGPRSEQIKFQVSRWNPEDGVTVVKSFDAGPGEVIGDNVRVYVPSTDGTEKKSKPIDFNSHSVVLDAVGGSHPLPQPLGTGRLEVPALSLLLKADGTVVVRNQADDVQDEVRKDMDETYKRELAESGKERKSSMGRAGSASRRRRRR